MCQKYAENARKRLNFYSDAILSQDSSAALGFILQAQPLAQVGEKLLQSIKHKQVNYQYIQELGFFGHIFCSDIVI